MAPSHSSQITQAKITWQTDENGLSVPTSSDFGDVYFSKTDGLAESRHVFINGNDLANRLQNLSDFDTFVIGEIGFGTGLNVLAIWQLWHNIIANSLNKNTRLHIITTEKFPLTKSDLIQALSVWGELQPFAQQLIDNYPPPLTGCHRLNFWADRLTLDIWLGDATDSLAKIIGNAKVDVWWLDGFSPSCNGELWANDLFRQIARLSDEKTTLATFSVASVVKKGLIENGFTLAKRKGFGKKREMLTAKFNSQQNIKPEKNFIPPEKFSHLKFKSLKPTKLIHYKKTGSHFAKPPFSLAFARKKVLFFTNPRPTAKKQAYQFHLPDLPKPEKPLRIAIVGAGVAGLSTAWALALRGHKITLIDKNLPLSGASGNPRAVIAPKLTELERLPNNLHALGYLASLRYYPALAEFSREKNLAIFEKIGVLDLLEYNRVTAEQVKAFPPEFAMLLNETESEKIAGVPVDKTIYYPEASLVNTANFAKAVLSHPNIEFLGDKFIDFEQIDNTVKLTLENSSLNFDYLILCIAQATCDFLPHIQPFKFSRGQISWFQVKDNTKLPKLPLKYGGYCAKFTQNSNHYFMLGASFIRDTLDTTPTDSEHLSNLAEFEAAIGKELETPTLENWQGRAGIRSQTVDYLPLVGQVGASDSRVWTFSALGSKGYCYAPVCSELLAGLICGEILGLDKKMVDKLSPNRRILQK